MSSKKLMQKIRNMGRNPRELAAMLVVTAAAVSVLPGTAGAQEFGYKFTDSLTDPSKDAVALLAEGYRPAQFLNHLDECRRDILGNGHDKTSQALAIDECMDNMAFKDDVKSVLPWLAGAGLTSAFGAAVFGGRRREKTMATRVKKVNKVRRTRTSHSIR